MLITGGAGFIGHNLAIYLAQRGFSPLVLDSLERSNRIAVDRLLENGIEVVKGDVRDKTVLHELLKRVDFVVHAAAYVDVEESFEKPYEYIANNVGGTAAVASACTSAGLPLVYISSAAVYGNPVKAPISEDHPTNPISPYGLSKLLGEKVVEFYGGAGLKYVIIRPFNVYGIGQTGGYAGVVVKFLERACRGESLIVYGTGEQVRDFVHVRDLSRLIELVILKEPYGYVFNAGSGTPTKIIDLARLVLTVTGSNSIVIHEPPRRGDISVSWADISRAQALLGYQPRESLKDALTELVAHYCGHMTTS